MSEHGLQLNGKDFSELERKLQLQFTNKDLLVQAFCHRSFIHEHQESHLENNERLEFLGDAVIELIVTEYLYITYPEMAEGELTTLRAALVNARQLAHVAQSLEFNEYLLLSKGEDREEGKARMYILANTFEAFIGSLYLDFGYETCKEFLETYLTKDAEQILAQGRHKDAKSLFQERAQEQVKVTPMYKILSESGPDHQRQFRVGVFLKDELIAEGEGSSKQEAQEDAARGGLEKKKWI